MAKLTKRLIDSVAHPASGQVFYRDTELQGFALRATPGSKSFTYERRINGRSRRMTIGPYPGMTVEEARKEASKNVGEIAQGHDPATQRQVKRMAATWSDLEAMYLARHAPRKKSAIDDIGLLTHHLAQWRPRMLTSITREDVARLHAQMGTQPSRVVRPGRPISTPIPRTANKMVSLVRSMFNLAEDWGLYAGGNPCMRIKKFPEVSRDRFVTPEELPRLLTALGSDPNQFVRVAFLVSL
ncbi:MAG: integrase family protein, partial [Nitrospirales bacterium]